MIQKEFNCAKDETYYNKTNSSWSGYVETENERKERIERSKLKRKLWYENLNEKEKKIQNQISARNLKKWNNNTKGKTFEEIYGDEKGKEKRLKHSGCNNGRSKKILDIKTGKIFDTIKEVMEFYKIKKYETIRKKCNKGIEMKFI
jgi:hypothetical protein